MSARGGWAQQGLLSFQVWYNQKGFHSLPSYLNRLNNLLLWRLLPPAEDWRRYGEALSCVPHMAAFRGRVLEGERQGELSG